MKIALYGNMNNNLFSLSRYLKEKGYDVDLLLFKSEFDHFEPGADSYEENNCEFIKKIDWTNYSSTLNMTTENEIKNLVDRYDFHIGCGASPAYFAKINKQLDIFIPYGSDLYKIPFYHFNFNRVRKLLKDYNLSKLQKKGIEQAKNIFFDITNDSFENILSKFNITGKRYFSSIPFIYLPEYSNENIIKRLHESSFGEVIKKFRRENEIIFVHHSGHCWKNPQSKFHNKGNNEILIGLKILVQKYPQMKIKLVTFEYGLEVEESKQLIRELGINVNIIWLPKSQRKDIMVVLSLADAGIAEIANSWFSYGTVFEYLALGIPVIMNRNDELYVKHHPVMYPVFKATNSIEVFEQMDKIVKEKRLAMEVGVNGYKWFKEYAIQKPLNQLISIIEKSELGKSTSL